MVCSLPMARAVGVCSAASVLPHLRPPTPFGGDLLAADEAESACDDSGGGIRVRQSRYLPLGSTGSRNASWEIPICIRHGTGGVTHETCELLTETSKRIRTATDVRIGSCPTPELSGTTDSH